MDTVTQIGLGAAVGEAVLGRQVGRRALMWGGIYTTNAIESLNYSLRKLLKTRGAFPNDDAIVKILYLAINRVAKKWTMPIRDWKAALNQFVILFGDRVPV